MPTKETLDDKGAMAGRGDSSWMDAGQSVHEQFDYICEAARTNEHQREMYFLRNLMLYDETLESHELEKRIDKAERNERCARRAIGLMAVVTGFALASLGYSAILLDDFFQNEFQLVIRLFCALGLASLVSLMVYMGFWIVARTALHEQREGCRRLVTRIVESRLGKHTDISSTKTLGTRPPGFGVEENQPNATNKLNGPPAIKESKA